MLPWTARSTSGERCRPWGATDIGINSQLEYDERAYARYGARAFNARMRRWSRWIVLFGSESRTRVAQGRQMGLLHLT